MLDIMSAEDALSLRARAANHLSARVARALVSEHWDTITNGRPFKLQIKIDGVDLIIYAPNAVTCPDGTRAAIWASLSIDSRAHLEWRGDFQVVVIGGQTTDIMTSTESGRRVRV